MEEIRVLRSRREESPAISTRIVCLDSRDRIRSFMFEAEIGREEIKGGKQMVLNRRNKEGYGGGGSTKNFMAPYDKG